MRCKDRSYSVAHSSYGSTLWFFFFFLTIYYNRLRDSIACLSICVSVGDGSLLTIYCTCYIYINGIIFMLSHLPTPLRFSNNFSIKYSIQTTHKIVLMKIKSLNQQQMRYLISISFHFFCSSSSSSFEPLWLGAY